MNDLDDPQLTPWRIPDRGDPGVKLADAITALVVTKKQVGCSANYVRSLKLYLLRFAKGRENSPLSAVSDIATVEQWLPQFAVAESRQTNLYRLSALFSYATRRQWIPANPIQYLEKVRQARKPPVILEPSQSAALLHYARTEKPAQLAYYSLGMLAGVRPEELAKITWDAICLDDGTVVIDSAASKTRRRRIIFLEPATIQWLRLAKEKQATLPIPTHTRKRYVAQARRVLGFEKFPQDLLRHTAASYLLARHQDAGKVALMLGHGESVLHVHYKNLVTQKACAEFWSFTPDSPPPGQTNPEPPAAPSAIDMAWTRFKRVEAALQAEPAIRALAQQRKRTGSRQVDRVDTIRRVAALAGCGRKAVWQVKEILKAADPDTLDELRDGKLSIASVYKRVRKPDCGLPDFPT